MIILCTFLWLSIAHSYAMEPTKCSDALRKFFIQRTRENDILTQRDEWGNTLLHTEELLSQEYIKCICHAGININDSQNPMHETPLHCAAEEANEQKILALLHEGANPWLLNRDNQSMFDIIQLNRHKYSPPFLDTMNFKKRKQEIQRLLQQKNTEGLLNYKNSYPVQHCDTPARAQRQMPTLPSKPTHSSCQQQPIHHPPQPQQSVSTQLVHPATVQKQHIKNPPLLTYSIPPMPPPLPPSNSSHKDFYWMAATYYYVYPHPW